MSSVMLAVWSLHSVAFGWNVVEIGDSNCKGTVSDTVWGGVAVQSGYVYWHNGVPATTWPSGNNPTPAKGPYLIDLAIADGDTSGYYLRRCSSGSTSAHGVNSPLTSNWTGLKADVISLGSGDPDTVIIDLGANDSNELAESNLYQGNMQWLIDEINNEWGAIDIVIAREKTTNNGALNTYPYLRTTIYTAQDNLVLYYGNVRIADTLTTCDLYDAIHWSTGGHGEGQECLAGFVWIW
jgi:hypothetical protein